MAFISHIFCTITQGLTRLVIYGIIWDKTFAGIIVAVKFISCHDHSRKGSRFEFFGERYTTMELMTTKRLVVVGKNHKPLHGAALSARERKIKSELEGLRTEGVSYTTTEGWQQEKAEKARKRLLAQNPPCGKCHENTPKAELEANDGWCYDCREADNQRLSEIERAGEKRLADIEWSKIVEASKRPCKGCEVRLEPFAYKNGKGFCSSDCRSQFRANKLEAERLAVIEASKEPCSECEQQFVPEELKFGWCATCKSSLTAEQFAACDGCGQTRGYSKLEVIEIGGVERRICVDSVDCLELAFTSKLEPVAAVAETAAPAVTIAKRKRDAMIKYGVDGNGRPKNRRKPDVPKSARKKGTKEQPKKAKSAGSTGQ